MQPTLANLRNVCHAAKKQKVRRGTILSRSYGWHRDVGLLLTWFVVRFLPWLTPNHLSALMLATGLGAVAVLALPAWWSPAAAGTAFYVSFLLDKVDGDVARWRQQFSDIGKWLDELYHLVPQSLLFIAWGVHLGDAWVALGMCATACAIVVRAAPKLASALKPRAPSAAEANPTRPSLLRELFLLPVRFDVLCLLLCASAAHPTIGKLLFATVAVVTALRAVLVGRNTARSLA
jgi:phosphatidylglycerophosphate synthase